MPQASQEIPVQNSIPKTLIRRFLVGVGIITLAAGAAPAMAHADTLGQYANWTVSVNRDDAGAPYCAMSTQMRDGGAFAVIGNANGVWLRATDANWNSYANQDVDVDAVIDDVSFTGVAHADGENTVIVPVGANFIADIIEGQNAELHIGDDITWTLDLTGTEDAGYEMSRCMDAISG